MKLNVVSKINTRLKFIYQKNKFLSPQLRRLLCNARIQPHSTSIMHAQFGTPTSIKKSKQVTSSSKQMCKFLPSAR